MAKSQAVELGAVVFYEVEAEVVLELPAIVFASAKRRSHSQKVWLTLVVEGIALSCSRVPIYCSTVRNPGGFSLS